MNYNLWNYGGEKHSVSTFSYSVLNSYLLIYDEFVVQKKKVYGKYGVFMEINQIANSFNSHLIVKDKKKDSYSYGL